MAALFLTPLRKTKQHHADDFRNQSRSFILTVIVVGILQAGRVIDRNRRRDFPSAQRIFAAQELGKGNAVIEQLGVDRYCLAPSSDSYRRNWCRSQARTELAALCSKLHSHITIASFTMWMHVAKTTIEATTKVDGSAFLEGAGITIAGTVTKSVFAPEGLRARAFRTPPAQADYTLKIELTSIEIAPGVVIKTTAYNGRVPGPILRVREGASVMRMMSPNRASIPTLSTGAAWPLIRSTTAPWKRARP